MKCSYEQFEKEFGYEFKDKSLLKKAFTHTTYVFEHKGKHYDSNQCLEFIGDGVLDCVIGRLIFEKKPYEDEGYLSKTRSLIVCEKSLAKVARKLHMGELLLLGKGETSTGGADKDSTLADAFESVIAAVFVDSCYEEAKRVIISNLSEIIDDALEGRLFLDYKSKLLELAQSKNNQHQVEFKVVGENGPSHMKVFDVEVYAEGILLAKASGKSKKEAEQNCAQLAIDEFVRLFDRKK